VGADAPDKPDGALAAALAATATARGPIAVERFPTGLQHYVFEVRFADRAPVVVRIASEQGRPAMIGAAKLSGMLRPLGVPLPRIIAQDLGSPFPHLVLERLPGTDLGNVVKTLPASRWTRLRRLSRRRRGSPPARRPPGATVMESSRPTRPATGGPKFSRIISPGRGQGSPRPGSSTSSRLIRWRNWSLRRAVNSTLSPRSLSFTTQRRRMSSSRRTALSRASSTWTICVSATRGMSSPSLLLR
jgi:hypothetical protein